MNSQSEITGLEIAVIGLACRFPGALTHDQFWDNLKNGRESVSFLSDEEIRELKISPDMLANKNFVRSKGSYIENKNHFDHAFFGYSQREAAVMDPQTRIMHECVWSALEDAGCNPLDYPGKIGLVAGLSPNYSWLRRSEQNTYARELGFFHASTLVERDFSSLHVAYRMNLTGPSYVIFTTCSTSLVAVHQACRALLTGESNMMVAGGVSFTQDTMGGYFFQEGMIFSADGHCRAFDKDSSGTVRGEGAGFVVLKRLKNALLDKDNIYAVIKGSAVNNDGNNKTGFFAPSVQGQKQVIQDALKTAKVDPQTVTLIEAHGTGTHIGDPIEIAGLTQAFGSSEHQYCAVGSVKSNLGHLDAAAGIASFIKTVLCIQHKWLAPSLNYKAPNPHINFAETPFYVIDQSRAWEGELLRAGVSSFGIGGTNAHVILENFDQKDTETIDRPELILLSARTKERVNKLADDLVNYSSKNKTNYSDLAFTLQTGRRHFPERAFAVTGSIHGAENLKNKFQFQATAHNSILLLTECDLESMDALLCMAAYNASLNEIVQSVLQALTERFNCSAADLNKTMTPVEVKQINCFCFQYAITAFLDKIGIIPRHIYTCSIGAQVMNALNGQTSLQKALGYIYEGCISFKSYEEGKHPYHELTDIGWQKQEPGTLIAMGKPPAYIEPHSILQGSVLLGTSGAREDFMQLLLYTGRAWTAGALVDFNYFNKGMSNRKISLPSYPFEPVKIESPLSQIKAVPEFEKWFYRFSWKKTDLIPPSEHQETQMPVLVITDNAPVTFSLTEKLKNEKPLKLIDISNADEPLVLIEAAVTEFNAGETKVILYLGFDSPTPLLSADNPARRLDLLFYKTLDIIRLLGRKNSQAFEVDLVLNCSVQVTGTDPVNYFLAPVHALAKIIPLEMKNIRCRLIDMGEDFHHSANQQVLASLVNTVTGENFFAIRNGTSWIKKLERFSPEKINKAPSYVRDKGVYLITGGFGGMGLAIADHLLTNSNATVILVGRRALHDIQRQQPVDFDILAKFPDRLEYQQAEIANAETIEAVSKKMFAKYKAINGIFHTAGLADFGGIAERRSNQSIDQVLQPKIHGTINLFKWLESDDLDFMVLFSSVGNILYKDKIGQLGYNAGNEFLDSFSQFAPKLITINWSDWKERGMTVDSIRKKYSAQKAHEIINSLNAISNSDGIALMNCILNTGEKNLIVSNADLFEKLVKPQVFAVQDTNGQYSSLEEIKSTLKSFLEETFDITIEDDTEDFFDLGADSLTIINSIPKIDKLLGIKIAVNDFYENATLKKLSETLFVKSNEGLLKTKGKVAVKLSEGTHKIFAFPPAIGIGFLSYANLPAFFPRYSIHAMNFLTDADRIEQYCAYITERSAHEKVILLGYSAGGTLAFEVAKALGQNKVSCLIILDSYIYRKRYSHDKKARQALSDFFQQTKINYGAETFKAVTSSMARYYFYVNNLVSDGKVDADIHLLKAMDRDAEELKNRQYVQSNNLKNNYKTWDQLTSGRYYEYNGTGVHNTLFNPGNFEQNMHLVQKMLL